MANYEMENEYVKWSPDLMVEVELETPDSFLLAKEHFDPNWGGI
jgi:hypothetical protein